MQLALKWYVIWTKYTLVHLGGCWLIVSTGSCKKMSRFHGSQSAQILRFHGRRDGSRVGRRRCGRCVGGVRGFLFLLVLVEQAVENEAALVDYINI
jgi:hypothetical protein